jgi:hypothetical protein
MPTTIPLRAVESPSDGGLASFWLALLQFHSVLVVVLLSLLAVEKHLGMYPGLTAANQFSRHLERPHSRASSPEDCCDLQRCVGCKNTATAASNNPIIENSSGVIGIETGYVVASDGRVAGVVSAGCGLRCRWRPAGGPFAAPRS